MAHETLPRHSVKLKQKQRASTVNQMPDYCAWNISDFLLILRGDPNTRRDYQPALFTVFLIVPDPVAVTAIVLITAATLTNSTAATTITRHSNKPGIVANFAWNSRQCREFAWEPERFFVWLHDTRHIREPRFATVFSHRLTVWFIGFYAAQYSGVGRISPPVSNTLFCEVVTAISRI